MGKTIRGTEREIWRRQRDSIRRQIRMMARIRTQDNLAEAEEDKKAADLLTVTQMLAAV